MDIERLRDLAIQASQKRAEARLLRERFIDMVFSGEETEEVEHQIETAHYAYLKAVFLLLNALELHFDIAPERRKD